MATSTNGNGTRSGLLGLFNRIPTNTDPLAAGDMPVGVTQPEPDPGTVRPRAGALPIGQSGRANFYGLPQPDELNRELIGILGLRKFDEMYRTDPDIRRLILMITSPIQAGTWSLDPHGGDNATPQDEMIADAVWWALTEFMSPDLFGHLEAALPMVFRFGFTHFEQMWAQAEYTWPKPDAMQRSQPDELPDGTKPDPIDPDYLKHAGKQSLLMPRKLDVRLPRTIWKQGQDDFGELTYIAQLLPNKADVVIPATELVHYRIGAEGDNWVGTSLLRHAYKPWFYKDRLERIDAIGQERKAVGVPLIYPSTNADDQTRSEVEAVFASLHVNDVGYVEMPGPWARNSNTAEGEGWDVDVIQFDSSSGDSIQASLTYHQLGIAGSVLGDFMQLGHHQVGAKATADIQEDPFLTAVRGFAMPIVAPLQKLVNRIVELNWADAAGPPKLKLSLTDDSSLSELATFIQLLEAAGAITVDPELEDYVRQRANLPPANATIRQMKLAAQKTALEAAANPPEVNPVNQTPPAMAPEPKPGQQPAAKPGAKPANPRSAAAKKTLDQPDARWFDRLLSQGELKTAMDGARTSVEKAAGPIALQLARQLASNAPPDTSKLADALTGEYRGLYTLGHQTVQAEIAQQQNKALMTPSEFLAGLGSRVGRARQRGEHSAKTIADTVTTRLRQAQIAGLKDATELQQLAEQTAVGQLHVEAMNSAAASINDGRWDAASANPAIVGAFYTSVLDERTCDECEAADTGNMISLDEASDLGPPNPECAGGDRCRCMLVYVTSDDPTAVGDVVG